MKIIYSSSEILEAVEIILKHKKKERKEEKKIINLPKDTENIILQAENHLKK